MDENTKKVMWTNNKDDWETPQDLIEFIKLEFPITLDVCANELNHKFNNYFTPEINGLEQKWEGYAWCNPPYSTAKKWVKKAQEEATSGNATTIMLLPSRTDTKMFHDYIWNKKNVEVRFIKGRLQFVGARWKAPFPSMIVIFNKVN